MKEDENKFNFNFLNIIIVEEDEDDNIKEDWKSRIKISFSKVNYNKNILNVYKLCGEIFFEFFQELNNKNNKRK